MHIHYCLMSYSEHAGPDSEAFFGYGQLWPLRPVTASYGHYGQRAASIGPDSIYAGSEFSHPIRFRFSKEGPDRIAQNRPGSDLDGLVRLRPNASGPEASQCAGIIGPGSGGMH